MPSASGHASLLGNTFAGYRVLGLIGRGAMGAVYLAQDLSLKRPVALKVMLGSLARNPVMVKSFQREAQAAAPLRHPNIVRIYNAGVEHGTPYIAMEYIEGEPLDRFLRRKGSIPWQTALFIAEQVADALGCAHDNGIIHRDVKPGNILLDKDGRVRLTDFGIANLTAEDHGKASAKSFIGTPHYMSPEQCSGRALTPTSDLFSLGVMLYRLIAGRLPFDADSPMELIQKIRSVDPPRLNRIVEDVPDDVARLVAHLMQKRPEARPGSAQAVQSIMRRLIAEQGGRSALPAALSAFIREEAEVRSVRRVDGGSGMRGLRGVEPKRGSGLRSGQFRAAFLAIAMVLAAIVGAWSGWGLRQPLPVQAAPLLEFTSIRAAGSSMRIAELPVSGFSIADLSFLGDSSVLVLRLEGHPHTVNAGASGLLAADVTTFDLFSVRPPVGPALDGPAWERAAQPLPVHRYPPMPPGSPLTQSIVVAGVQGSAVDGAVVLRGQAWTSSMPRASVVAELPRSAWVPAVSRPGMSPSPGIALSPDGETLCIVRYDSAWGGNYLVERHVTVNAPGRMSEPLTAPGEPIDPRSIQYSPQGDRIAYMRVREDQRRELWILDPNSGRTNGIPLILGALEDVYAFAPNGRMLLAAQRPRVDSAPELRLVSAVDGRVLASPGPGVPAKAPWHPSGRYFIAHAPDVNGVPQMFAVETEAPHRRLQITDLEQGTGPGAVLMADGQKLAVPLPGAEAAILVIDLRSVDFDSPGTDEGGRVS